MSARQEHLPAGVLTVAEAARKGSRQDHLPRGVLNVSEVVKRIGYTNMHVRNLFHAGKLDGYQSGPHGSVRIYEASVTAFLERHRASVDAYQAAQCGPSRNEGSPE